MSVGIGVLIGAVLFGATRVVQNSSAPSLKQEQAAVKAVVSAAEDLEVANPYPLPSTITDGAAVFQKGVTPHAWIDATTKRAYIPATVMQSSLAELRTQLSRYFSPTLAAQIEGLATSALREQSGGSDVAGSGGASVLRYDSVVVEGRNASVQAVVSQWSTQGYISSATGALTWTNANTQVLVTDTLAQSASGAWLVTSRQWQFVPGYTP